MPAAEPQTPAGAEATPPATTITAPKLAWTKKSKLPYSGPTNVIGLPPTPMLDDEGKQRLDPDGKPMFNPPVKQERDRYGHPIFDEHGNPVFQTATDLGYDENGHRIHGKKQKPPKTVSVNILRGTLTVDGLIGKAALNYDIKDFRYVYLYAPWIGTVVISNVSFPGSREQKNAFDRNTLTVNVEEHTFQVFSETMMLGKKSDSAFVAVDRDFKLPTKVPVIGYGATIKAPYNWPGAKPSAESRAYVKPPPVPQSLRPTLLLPPCPPGQMRQTAGVKLPGDDAPAPECVAIVAGKPWMPAARPAPSALVVAPPVSVTELPSALGTPTEAAPAPPSPTIAPATNGNPDANPAVAPPETISATEAGEIKHCESCLA